MNYTPVILACGILSGGQPYDEFGLLSDVVSKTKTEPCVVAYAYNPKYSGGRKIRSPRASSAT